MNFKDKLDAIFEGLGTSRFTHLGMPVKRSFTPDTPPKETPSIEDQIAELEAQLNGDPEHDSEIKYRISELINS
jgi:hypothetical protein